MENTINIDKYLTVAVNRDTKIFVALNKFSTLPLKMIAVLFLNAHLILHSQPGRYTFLEDIKTLRSIMATYYNLFALGKQLDPVVSVPYIDAFGTGTINLLYPELCLCEAWWPNG